MSIERGEERMAKKNKEWDAASIVLLIFSAGCILTGIVYTIARILGYIPPP